jgi:hypothetical protein
MKNTVGFPIMRTPSLLQHISNTPTKACPSVRAHFRSSNHLAVFAFFYKGYPTKDLEDGCHKQEPEWAENCTKTMIVKRPAFKPFVI